MNREIKDKDYIEFLGTELYQNRYFRWKKRMLPMVDAIVEELPKDSLENVMKKFDLTPRDVALLVRLNYVSEEVAVKYGLKAIEEIIPA